MRFKKLLAALAVVAGLCLPSIAFAVTANYTTYSSGQTLTAASLNSLQTNYTNGDNAILDGDTFTGNMLWYSGVDALFYSDAGSTLRAGIYADSGHIVGATRVHGTTSNCEINYSAGTITISGWGGVALSATNPCIVNMRSNSNGVVAVGFFTANVTTTDGATSDTDSNLFGVTDANWANAMPIFFGVIYDGATPYFGFGRKPHVVSGAAAGDLAQEADTDGDGENDFLIMTTGLTLSAWVNLPITQVAWLTGTYATTGGAWTFAETAYTGFNALYESIYFTMPLAQNGAATGTYFLANGGTAPLFTTNNFVYQMHPDGSVTCTVDLEDDPGTDGVGAVTSLISMPYSEALAGAYYVPLGSSTSVGGAAAVQMVIANPNGSSFGLIEPAGTSMQNGDFSNGGRNLIGTFTYQAL